MTSVLLHTNILVLIFSSYGQPLARFYYSEVTEFILFHLISTVGLLAVIVQKPDCILMVNFGCLYPNLRCYGATQLYIAWYGGTKSARSISSLNIQGWNFFGIWQNFVKGICVIDHNYVHNNATQYNLAFSKLAHGAARERRGATVAR